MSDNTEYRTEYLKSIAESDLQKFIIDHMNEDPEKLLVMCIDYLKEHDYDA